MSSKLFSLNLMVHINHNIPILLYFAKYSFPRPHVHPTTSLQPTIEALPEWLSSPEKISNA